MTILGVTCICTMNSYDSKNIDNAERLVEGCWFLFLGNRIPQVSNEFEHDIRKNNHTNLIIVDFTF